MFGRLCNATVWGGDEDYSSPIQDRDGLSPTPPPCERVCTELRAMCGWTLDVYDRIVAPSSSRPSGHPEGSCCTRAQNCHLYSALWVPTVKKICEDIPTPQLHLTRALIRLTSTRRDVQRVGPVSPTVFLLQNDVKMTNEPPTMGCDRISQMVYMTYSI